MGKHKQAIETEETLSTAMEDRISQLPIPILHRILYFLTQKAALRTCVLSKQWRHIGSTRPNLKFFDGWFGNTQENFVSIVGRTLQGYLDQNLSIHKLQFFISIPDPRWVISLLDKWIPIIAGLNIKAFKLIYYSEIPEYYDLPSAVFLGESLEKLHLYQCRVSPVEIVQFKCLRKLTLIYVEVDDGTLETIMLGCPLLRSLVINNCKGLRNVRLSEAALPELKHFDLEGHEWWEEFSIEIHALNLETICIRDPWIWSNCQSTLLFSRLTSVDLSEVILSSESFDLLSFGCPTLERLTLNNCSSFEAFYLANDSVKYLRISTRDNLLKGVTICAPNIVSFDFTAGIPQAPPDTFSFTTTTSKEWYSNVILSLGEKHLDFDVNWWFLKLRRMLKALSGSQISLTLRMDGGPRNVPCSAVVSDEPPVVVRDLDFTTCKRRTASWYLEFTNGLFRFCRPTHVYGCWLVRNSDKKYRLSKFQFNILLAKKSLRTEPCFWQHDLEQVFVETLDGQQWQLMQWTRMGKLRRRKEDRNIRLRLKWRC